MAQTDPQSIKISGVTTSLPRVDTGNFGSVYLSSDGSITLKYSTQESNRKRHVARVDVTKVTADPLDDARNVEVSMSAYLVIDRPKFAGYTNAEALAVVTGLLEALTAESSAKVTKLLGSES